MSTARETLQAAIDELGVTVRAVFVPWSESRNKGERGPSLNWRVTLVRAGRDVLTTDYGAGSGHCPSHKDGDRSEVRRLLVEYECERGLRAVYHSNTNTVGTSVFFRTPILPDTCSVIYSLVSDADALNYARFEDWASSLGYSTDSRAAEAAYRACLEIGLALRSAIGEDGLRKLTEACQGF